MQNIRDLCNRRLREMGRSRHWLATRPALATSRSGVYRFLNGVGEVRCSTLARMLEELGLEVREANDRVTISTEKGSQ